MKISPNELLENGYILLDHLEHKELVPFIRTYIKKKTFYSFFYNLCTIFFFGLATYLLITDFKSPSYNFLNRFNHLTPGIGIAFLLIPLHEYIHVLAYRSQGALNTSYDTNIKKFYFLALADGFVVNKKEFEIVALAPFVVISLTLTVLFFLVNSNWMITIAGTLLAHTAMCSGDFGLLSYFQFHKDKEIVTYDDKEEGISYFYGKNK